MSTPSSRISAYRSYSYYHVLAMCDSSNTAELLSTSTAPNAWKHTLPDERHDDGRTGVLDLGKYSPKCIEYINGDLTQCRGKYIVLIDGAQDAAYVITQARWSSATAASAVPGDGNTSLAVEGSVSLSEPKGVAFLDQVVKCSIALGVDASQVVYCLKTFFVGFTDQDTVEVIGDIPPIMFTTYDVTGAFTEEGGKYEMLFVALANGTSRLPQYSKAANSMTIKSGATLKQTMENLQQNIRESYDRYFNCVYNQLKEQNTPQATQLMNSLCRVNYVIALDPDEGGYTDESYRVTDQPPQLKNKVGCDEESQIAFPANTSIETAIATIMNMCPKVRQEMAVSSDKEQVRYEFKIHTAVSSTPTTGSTNRPGQIEYTVYYRIERFASPKSAVYDPVFQLLAQDNAETVIRTSDDPKVQRIRNSIIEFDYLYTGKNIDILEFDIKVNMGMAYLQTATLANTLKGQTERTPLTSSQVSAYDVDRLGTGPAMQTPVFFGKQIGNPKFLNTQNSSASIQSAYTLSKHASIEVAEAEMTIVGNDLLLMSTNGATSPERMIALGDSARRATLLNEEDKNGHFPSWTLTPAFAKINIKMPRNNDDTSLFSGRSLNDTDSLSVADYAVDFWFDGYYYVYGIDHIFDAGEFRQTLHMIGIPKASTFESTKSQVRETAFDTKVSECYDGIVGCGSPTPPSASSPSVSIARPVPKEQIPPKDAETINNLPRTLAHVKGWNAASPQVKTAIINAAAAYGVDPVVLAQVCYQESKFNPSAKSPYSSATGLFQFLNGTWAPSSLGTDAYLTEEVLANKNNRLDPQLNAYAGAKYLARNAQHIGSSSVGDLYLAHFLGPGTGQVGKTSAGAKGVIAQDNATNGTMTLTELVGSAKAQKIANANTPYITPNMTVRDLRAWANDKMTGTLTTPYTVARSTTTTTQTTTPKASDRVAAQQSCKVQSSKDSEEQKSCTQTASVENKVNPA